MSLSKIVEDGPHAAEIWDVSGHGVNMSALCLGEWEKDPRVMYAIPVVFGLDEADAQALYVRQEQKRGAFEYYVWPQRLALTPLRTFVRPCAQVDAELLLRILEGELPTALDVMGGEGFDPAVNTLDMAGWLAMCSDTLTLPPLVEHGTVPQAAHAERRGRLLKQVANILDVSPSTAMNIIKGTIQPDMGQKAKLEAAGVELDAGGRTSSLPADLLVEIEQPYWHARVMDYQRRHPDTTDPWRDAARDAFRLAARRNGTGRDKWKASLERVLDDTDGGRS